MLAPAVVASMTRSDDPEPFVVIGGDAAGLSAASKLKREDPDREVVVYERGGWVSYAHCGLPYYVKGEVEQLTDLLSLRPDEIADRGIDLRRYREVLQVHPDRGTITVAVDGERVERPYGELLVATGARPVSEPIEGSALEGVFTIHGLDRAAALRAFLAEPGTDDVDLGLEALETGPVERYADADPPETVGIVGGGYVGVEMAEALVARGLEVHLFQRGPRPLAPFGEAVGDRVAETLADEGVSLHLETSVEALAGEGWVEAVETDSDRVPVDCAVVGVGVRPNVGPVVGTDVELGDSGAIATDEYGGTSVEGIYAAGDCAEAPHVVTGEPDWVPLGLTANRAGRAIGATLGGEPTPVGGIAGTAVVKAFDLECGRTGLLDDATARAAGFDPIRETITAGSRSGYYPGGDEMTVTLVADRHSGRLLGGAIAGRDRAAVRINAVATALEGGLTVGEVESLDLAYAPPFSPVWDPVLVAAKVLGGRLG